jgi:hypothetical protein
MVQLRREMNLSLDSNVLRLAKLDDPYQLPW